MRRPRLFDMPPDPEARVLPARRLVDLSGMAESVVDVERLARMVGVRRIDLVATRDMEACLIPDKYGYTILVNKFLSPTLQRFSIAHEIGHVLLRAKCRKYRIAQQAQRSSPEEIKCDELAAEMLMPRQRFTREMEECEPSLSWIESLAARYDVPVEAAAMRFGFFSRSILEVICWRRERAEFVPQWTAGSELLIGKSKPKSTSCTDYSSHVVRAFTSGRLTVERKGVRVAHGSGQLESRRFGTALAPSILTLAKPIPSAS